MSFLDHAVRKEIALKCFDVYRDLVQKGTLSNNEEKPHVRLKPRIYFYNSPSSRTLPPEQRFAELQYQYETGKKYYRVKINKASITIYHPETGHKTGIKRTTLGL